MQGFVVDVRKERKEVAVKVRKEESINDWRLEKGQDVVVELKTRRGGCLGSMEKV